jgi:hypothetical protein
MYDTVTTIYTFCYNISNIAQVTLQKVTAA